MSIRVVIVTTHPIQYQAPLFRALERIADIELTVLFGSDQGFNRERVDPGFGQAFAWDVDLLSGYRNIFVAGGHNEQLHGWRFDAPALDLELAQLNPDCIIVFGWNKCYYWRAIRWAWKHKVPLLVRGDSNLQGKRYWYVSLAKRLIFPAFFRRLNGFLVVGKYNRELYEYYGVPKGKLFSTPHCVDNDFFRTQAEAESVKAHELRGAWGGDEQTVVFLFVGKLADYKRPLDAITAMLNIRDPHCRLVIVGDGPQMQECRSLASQDQLKRIHFAGFKNQSELPAYYAAADVLLLPSSREETWGLVVNEAMASGLPCIISDGCGCMPDLIVDGETGYSFPLGDVLALCDWMQQVIENKKELDSMKKSAMEKIQDFSLSIASQGVALAVQKVVHLSVHT